MQILIVSTHGSSLPLAYRLEREGHDVFFYIEEDKYENNGYGLTNRVESWQEHVEGSDLIVFDYTGWANEAEELREKGHSVVGPTQYSDALELEREFGQKEFHDAGLDILPTTTFKSIDDCIKFVQENPARYVVKPDGKAGDEKSLTYVGKDENGDDLVAVLQHYASKYAGKIDSLAVQPVVEGVEIGVSAFYNGTNFVEPVELSFEHKKLFPGELGPNTGEMGTSQIWVDSTHPLFQKVLYPLEDKLQGYVGYFDINCIINEHGVYPLEATCRFGYPTIALNMETLVGNFGDWLKGLADGKQDPMPVRKDFSVVVVVAVAPFPYDAEEAFKKQSEGNLILGHDQPGVWPVEVNIDVTEEGRQWVVGGCSGEVLYVTGSGPSMQDAKTMAYSRVSNLVIPNAFYRTDISDRWAEDYPRLLAWGWMSSTEYGTSSPHTLPPYPDTHLEDRIPVHP